MSSYYKCSFFEQDEKLDFKNFIVHQKELLMNEIYNDGKISFSVKDVEYFCSFEKQKSFDSNKPTLLIPIKDNLKLISYTIDNLRNKEVLRHANVVIIDDRSEEDIKTCVLSNELSYLRVDNNKGFNFSMLNNIAAKICFILGAKDIVLWNSDLWAPDSETFPELLTKHKQAGSKISGTKLLYPPLSISLDKTIDTKNIKKTFPNLMNGKWRETVQFGGDLWTPVSGVMKLAPGHNKRFSRKDNPLVNCNKGVHFVTGAFQIWDLLFFISIGGLNPSLSKNFQDVDICLRSVESGDIYPNYFGKNIFLYHDESLNMHNLANEKKNDNQMISDHHLFAKLWNDKITKIVWGI